MRTLLTLLAFAAVAAAQTFTATAPQSFGLVDLGSSATRTVTVTAGNVPMTFAIASSSAQFTVNPSSFSLLAGASQAVTITYAPTVSPAIQRGRITITSGLGATEVALEGRVNPYGAPTSRLVCVLDRSTHAIVAVAGVPQCFSVPLAVDQAYQSYMLQAVEFDGQNQTWKHKYANVWDYITRYFITDVLSKLDQFPPAGVAEAKNDAQAAAAAIDAAKAAILAGATQ